MFPSKTVRFRGINPTSVMTLGQTTLSLVTNGKILTSLFEIVFDDFPNKFSDNFPTE